MSLTQTPNFNDYLTRIVEILDNSALLFPKTIGEDPNAEDLVSQVIQYELPIMENPIQGGGPPHIVVTLSRNPIYERKQVGRDDIDIQGPERLTLEFYIVVITQGSPQTYEEAQIQANNIAQAVTTTLDKKKRLTDKTNANPLAITLQWIQVPYLLPDNDQKELIAINIILRPDVYLNLR